MIERRLTRIERWIRKHVETISLLLLIGAGLLLGALVGLVPIAILSILHVL